MDSVIHFHSFLNKPKLVYSYNTNSNSRNKKMIEEELNLYLLNQIHSPIKILINTKN